MQASLALPGSPPDRSNRYSSGELTEFSGSLSEFFSRKLQIEEEKPESEPENNVEEEGEEEEFSFACSDLSRSPISAEEAFQDGQIRPALPILDRSLLFSAVDGGDSRLRPPLKKLFVADPDAPSSSSDLAGAPAGPYCEWRGRTAVEASLPGTCKKSNSTGFSKIRRFRDLVRRSNSDGKDAFVFLSEKVPKESDDKAVKKETTTGGGKERRSKTTPSAHEKHYVRNRARREKQKRRSYLPYRQGVVGVGFFTTVNGFSRNLHPF